MNVGMPEMIWGLVGLALMILMFVGIGLATYVVLRKIVSSGVEDAGVRELAQELAEARERAARAEAEVARLRERLEQEGHGGF